MKRFKQLSIYALAVMTVLLLAGCAKTEEADDSGAASEAESATFSEDYQKGYEAGLADGKTGASQAAGSELTPLYESDLLKVSIAPVREDSNGYYVSLFAENTSEEQMAVSLGGISLNGISAGENTGAEIPANGTAWIESCLYREDIEMLGDIGEIRVVKALLIVYDQDYNMLDSTVAAAEISDGEPAEITVPEGQEIYDDNGLKITYLGVGEDDDGCTYGVLCMENTNSVALYMSGEDGATAGEVLHPSVYGTILPGTRAFGRLMCYADDYTTEVSVLEIPYISAVFRISVLGENDSYILTDPLKIDLGSEQRFEVSSDGSLLKLYASYWQISDMEWLAVSSDESVLAVAGTSTKEVQGEVITDDFTAELKAVNPGTASVTLYYHKKGESVEESSDLYPSIYYQRTINFEVTQQKEIVPGEVQFSVMDYAPDEPVTYVYRIDKDGSLLEKTEAHS